MTYILLYFCSINYIFLKVPKNSIFANSHYDPCYVVCHGERGDLWNIMAVLSTCSFDNRTFATQHKQELLLARVCEKYRGGDPNM